MSKRKLIVGAAGVAVAGFGAALALGTSAQSASPLAPYSVFGAAAPSAETLAASPFTGDTGRGLSELVGVSFDAESVRPTGDGQSSPWVAADQDGAKVCLAQRSAPGKPVLITCDGAAGAAKNGLFAFSHAAPDARDQAVTVTALVPDGVTSVRLGGANDRAARVAVTNNALTTKVDFTPTEASLIGPNATTSVKLGGNR